MIKWAWSGSKPFGVIGEDEGDLVYGLAICQYEDSQAIYRFSCDRDWVVIQDGVYDSVDQAIQFLPDQYKNVKADWKDK